jgi:hypothetical protein
MCPPRAWDTQIQTQVEVSDGNIGKIKSAIMIQIGNFHDKVLNTEAT